MLHKNRFDCTNFYLIDFRRNLGYRKKKSLKNYDLKVDPLDFLSP